VTTTTRRFECRPTAVTAARRLVRSTLDGHDADLIDAAELMISELASNCVRHAQTDPHAVVAESVKTICRHLTPYDNNRQVPGA